MTTKTQRTPNWYRRLFAWGISKVNAADDNTISLCCCPTYETMAELKRTLFADLQGNVLEIGPGAGANFAYYPPQIHWIGVEPNPYMNPYLQQEAHRRGFARVELRQGLAEELPVDDASMDAVVSTHVLCSVGDVDTVLQEIVRVLKPGGRFLFVEHIAAEPGTGTRRVQEGIKPVWKRLFDNCHPQRETWKVLEQAGFERVEHQFFQIRVPVVGPHMAGVAWK